MLNINSPDAVVVSMVLSWPSCNIAVPKCQIDVAPLNSYLSHIPHIPWNRTPATRAW